MAKKQSSTGKRQRVNGIAAGVALLKIYEARGSDDRDSRVTTTAIERFLSALRAADPKAERGFWLIINDYITTCVDGAVPDAAFYERALNLSHEDVRTVRDQLGLAELAGKRSAT
jgi:hypothetical protein